MEKFSNLFYYRRSTWIMATTRIRYISHKGARAIDGGTEGPITDRGMRGVSRKMIPRVTLSGYTDRPRCSDYKPCSAWYATLHSIPHPWEPLTVPLVYQGNRVAFLASPPPPSLSLSLLSCPRFALPSFSSSFLLLFLHSLLYFSLLFFGDEVLWSRSRVRRARKRNTVETSCNFLATMRTRRFKLCPSLFLSFPRSSEENVGRRREFREIGWKVVNRKCSKVRTCFCAMVGMPGIELPWDFEAEVGWYLKYRESYEVQSWGDV